MEADPDRLDRLDEIMRRALDGEPVDALLAGLPSAEVEEAANLLAELGVGIEIGAEQQVTPSTSPPDARPEAEIVARFLDEYWRDRAAETVRSLSDYLNRHPGAPEAVARCYLALQGDSSATGGAGAVADRLGAFKLGEVLGRGGQATVYRATDEKLGRAVALKVFDQLAGVEDRMVGRFKREARALSRLNDPGIGRVFDAGILEGKPYIAMELIEGASLARHIADESGSSSGDSRSAKRDLDRKLVFLEKVARALDVAHRDGVIHRDLKPANILVRKDGSPVLVDFGLAAVADDEGAALTASRDLLGTPAYIAPERLRGGRLASSPQEDIYALGVTAYEYLSRARPFEAPTVEELFHKVLRGEAVPLEQRVGDLPRDLLVVVAVAMDFDPRHRYQDAAHLADDLARVRRGEPVSVRPLGVLTRSLRWYRRNAVFASSAIALVLALTAFALFVIKKNERIESLRQVAVERADELGRRNAENARLHEEAVARGNELERSLKEVLELSDIKRVEGLIAQEKGLLPIAPATLPRIDDWLARARTLAARGAGYRRQLDDLVARKKPMTSAEIAALLPREWRALQRYEDRLRAYDDGRAGLEGEAAAKARKVEAELLEPRMKELRVLVDELRDSNYPDAADAWRADVLARLVAGIDRLAAPDGVIAAVEARRERADTLVESTVTAYREPWDRVARELGEDPRFHGFRLEPIPGLVPLGRDPRSGLQEFLHALSHFEGPFPERGEDGQLPKLRAGQGLVFVLVPGGRFMMGAVTDPESADFDPNAAPHESPRREVELAPFLVSKYEFWAGLWLLATGRDPSSHQIGDRSLPDEICLDIAPVEFVSWYEAMALLRTMSLSLPTEAQWEYFARAGTTSIWSSGNDPARAAARMNIADARLARLSSESRQESGSFDDGFALKAPVDSYEPNPFGLYGIHGNVFEWCLDRYAYYSSPVRKGDGLRLGSINNGDMRIFRGGSYAYGLIESRSSNRLGTEASTTDSSIGLRPVMNLPGVDER